MATVETRNGVVDLSERGTIYSESDRIFRTWNDGEVFDYEKASVADFDEMIDRDGKAATLEAVLTLPLSASELEWEPHPDGRDQAEWLEEVLTQPSNAGGMSTPLSTVIAQMTNAVLYRRTYFEKVFEVRDGKIALKKIAWRPPESCTLDRDKVDGSFNGFKQRVRDRDGNFADKPVHIKPDRVEGEQWKAGKALVHIHDQRRSPLTGRSALETCWQLHQTKQKILYLWFRFMEDQTLPKATATTDKSDPAAAAALAKSLAGLKGGGIAGLTAGQSLDVFESNGRGAEVFQSALDYLSAEQAGSVLAGFTNLTDPGKTGGSYALHSDATDFFLMASRARLTEMAGTLNQHLLAGLCRLNFPDPKPPQIKFKPPTKDSAEQSIEMLRELSRPGAAAVPQEFIDMLIEKVASHLGLDVDRVVKAIEERVERGEDIVVAGAGAATQLVREVQQATHS